MSLNLLKVFQVHFVRRIAFQILTLSLGVFFTASATLAQAAPWRLDDDLGLIDGLSLSGAIRSRFENARNSLRASTPNDQTLKLRTRINLKYERGQSLWEFELMDSRQEFADVDGVVGNGDVNVLDIQQANVKFDLGSSETTLKLGRFTKDYGSRRVVARPIYRNTMNAFDGLVLEHETERENQFSIIASQPVSRLPANSTDALNNKFEWDSSSSDRRFYGLFTMQPAPLKGLVDGYFSALRTEFYLFSLREKGNALLSSHLETVGFRAEVRPKPGQFDFEIEAILQRGSSTSLVNTSSLLASQIDADQRSYFTFFELGYSFEMKSNLRVLFEFDYGSGDDLATPQRQERYNSLFGVSAFAYGPTGFYGVFNFSNTISPGLRASFNPIENLNIMASYRHFWLADNRDSLGRTGLRDISGNTDSYMGQHFELRARWDLFPENLRVEVGSVIYQPKGFQERNSIFTYAGFEFSF